MARPQDWPREMNGLGKIPLGSIYRGERRIRAPGQASRDAAFRSVLVALFLEYVIQGVNDLLVLMRFAVDDQLVLFAWHL